MLVQHEIGRCSDEPKLMLGVVAVICASLCAGCFLFAQRKEASMDDTVKALAAAAIGSREDPRRGVMALLQLREIA